MMFLTILRIYNSIGNGIQVNHYGVLYHLIIQVFLVILLVQAVLVLLRHLQICLWTYLIACILILLKKIKAIVTNNHLIITVSSTPTVTAIYSTPHVTTIHSEIIATPTPSGTNAMETPSGTAATETPSGTAATLISLRVCVGRTLLEMLSVLTHVMASS